MATPMQTISACVSSRTEVRVACIFRRASCYTALNKFVSRVPAVVCVTDGCGWGVKAAVASKRANVTFVYGVLHQCVFFNQ
jgi:hypothetical protein